MHIGTGPPKKTFLPSNVFGITGMIEQYVPIVIMILIGVIAGIVFTNINRWLGPHRPTEEKLSTYESGMEPVRSARERFSVKFYLVAMLFIVFDIEIVFLYPWAVVFRKLEIAGVVGMGVFLVILTIGLIYEWRKGGMDWR
jgi:NADH-quinone oxidoreductase subunit A